MKDTTPYLTVPMDDYYGDPQNYGKGLTLGGLYYYLITEEELKKITDSNKVAIPPTSAVISVNYMPYLDDGDMSLAEVTINKNNDQIPLPPGISTSNKFLRIRSYLNSTSNLGSVNSYKYTGTTSPGGSYAWQKEGKLWNYPYTFTELNDGVSTPLQIFPHLLSGSSFTVQCRNAINQNGMYLMYVPTYKGDSNGLVEGVVTSGLSIPVMSSAYTDYMVANQHTMKMNRSYGLLGAVASGVGSAVTGNVMGVVSSAISGLNVVESGLAKERDLMNTPNTLRSTGGDILFNMQINDKSLYAYRFQYPTDVMERLGCYFAMYGYKQNKLMTVNFKNRYFYNYIKMVQCNITANSMTKEDLNTFKNIFLNGTTVWHVTNSGVTVGDYSKDNYEV